MKAIIVAVFALAFSVNQALAVSSAVKMACASDYFAHCSMHSPGSPGVRTCMRAVGSNLSNRCMSALAAAGEVTKATYKKYLAKQQGAQKQLASSRKSDKRYAKAVAKKKVYAQKTSKKRVAAAGQIKKKRYATSAKKKYAKKQYDRRLSGREYAKRDSAAPG